ncbi:MAG: cupin domain-containing protein [Acidobacteriota bacterium]
MASFVSSLPLVIRPAEGLSTPLGSTAAIHKIPGGVTQGRLAIIEHTLPPRCLSAPMHRHSREDELSVVLAGQFGARLGDDVVVAGTGSYVLKPRGQWHTYWNAGDTDLRFIELLVPAGIEGYFERLSRLLTTAGSWNGAESQSLADEYGLQFDFNSVPVLCEQFGLRY